jgi:excisionase family DNA binding protein
MDNPLTPEEVAERWKCEVQLVRRCCRAGTLKSFRVGKLLRIRPEWVAEFEQCQITDSGDCTESSSASGKKAENAAAIALARESQRKQEQPYKLLLDSERISLARRNMGEP